MTADAIAYVTLDRPPGEGPLEAGGIAWNGGRLSGGGDRPITPEAIAGCLRTDVANVTGLQQNGADNGSFAADNYIGFRFTLAEAAGGLEAGVHEFKVGRGTLENNTPNTPPEFFTDEVDEVEDGRAQAGTKISINVIARDPDLRDLELRLTASIKWEVSIGGGAFETIPNTPSDIFRDQIRSLIQPTLPVRDINAPDLEVVYRATVTDGFATDQRSYRIIVVSEKDTTPPVAPSAENTTVSENPDGTLTVSGTTEPMGTVFVAFPDGTKQSLTTSDTGQFTVTSAAAQTKDGTTTIIFSDGFSNETAAYAVAFIAGPSVAETQAQIATFMQSRANRIIASQPDLIGLLSGTASGAFNLQATQGTGNFDFATSGDRNVWARLEGSWSEFDAAEGSYTFGVAGAHTPVGQSTLLGVMVQFDQFEQTEGDASTEGTGYLVGPYVVSKLPDQPLYFEGRLLVGQTANEVNVDGNTPEEFDTTRALASAKVAGNLAFGALTLTPNLTATHLSETQEAFTDSADNDIPEQSITMTDIALGLDVAHVFTLQGGALTVSGGLAAVMSSSGGSGLAEDVLPTFDGERGRMHLGARYALDSGMILSAGTSFDGLGSDDFESTSVNVGLQMQF